MRFLSWMMCLALLAVGCGHEDSKWVETSQKARDEAKAQEKANQQRKEEAVAAPKPDAVPKDPYWDDASLVRIDNDTTCPDGLWALFPGKAPGADKEEQKKNEARRSELVRKLKSARFVSRLKPPNDVRLSDFDAPRGQFTVTASGLVDCQDSAGHLVLTFTQAKAITPPSSAAKQGAEITLRIWDAKPYDFPVPMKSASDAKEWKSHHQFDLETRVVYTLGKAEVDHKMFRTSKVSAAGMTLGGGSEDWGAGRAVHANVEAVRLTTDRGRTALQETRNKK